MDRGDERVEDVGRDDRPDEGPQGVGGLEQEDDAEGDRAYGEDPDTVACLGQAAAEGAALVVANHAGVLPFDGLMASVAVKDKHPAHRDLRLLAADLVFDLRFLRNPHYEPALRPLTGRDLAVAAHVEADPDFPVFWTRLTGFLDPLLPRYVAEGKKYLTVALGCTGGRHRSVLVAERLTAHLRRSGWQADATHRELSPGTGDGAPSGHRAGLRDPPASEGPPAAEPEGREALFRTP